MKKYHSIDLTIRAVLKASKPGVLASEMVVIDRSYFGGVDRGEKSINIGNIEK